MSKAGSKGMAGMAMAIPIFVKSNILLHLAVTLPRGLLYDAQSNLVEPHSLVSTGEHGLYYSIVGVWP